MSYLPSDLRYLYTLVMLTLRCRESQYYMCEWFGAGFWHLEVEKLFRWQPMWWKKERQKMWKRKEKNEYVREKLGVRRREKMRAGLLGHSKQLEKSFNLNNQLLCFFSPWCMKCTWWESGKRVQPTKVAKSDPPRCF